MPRALRNLGRMLVIAGTLARHDALFPLERLGASHPAAMLGRLSGRVLRAWHRRRGSLASEAGRQRRGQRLAAALAALGPSFIKLGQALSVRPDLVGDEVAADLASLQDQLPPFPGEIARRIIGEELEAPLELLFRSFDPVPVAAASIAQVHFAETADGTPVAVKVLRPGIEAAFARDLELMGWLAELAERANPSLRRLRPVEAVATVAAMVRQEMDLRMEAAAADELAENFADDPGFRVPAVDWRRTGRRVMTQERVGGIRIDDRAALTATGHDPDSVLAHAAAAFFRQVFQHGFFHGDMHPGNCFIAEDGALIVVDFGIMGRVDRATQLYLAEMLVGFLSRNYALVADVHFRAGFVPPRHSRAAFAQACRSIGEPILGLPQSEISVARLLGHLFRVTEAFDMPAQPQLLLLQKTMLQAEGMGRTLSPNVNMWALAQPLIEDWMRERFGPEARLGDALRESGSLLSRLPAALADAESVLARLAHSGAVDEGVATARAVRRRGWHAEHTGWAFAAGIAAGLALAALF